MRSFIRMGREEEGKRGKETQTERGQKRRDRKSPFCPSGTAGKREGGESVSGGMSFF